MPKRHPTGQSQVQLGHVAEVRLGLGQLVLAVGTNVLFALVERLAAGHTNAGKNKIEKGLPHGRKGFERELAVFKYFRTDFIDLSTTLPVLWNILAIFQHFIHQNMSLVEDFNQYRSRMNERIMGGDNKVIKRLFNLDTNTYAEGALAIQTKEMIGLACSMVLRCDDCVKYHLGKCHELGVTNEQMEEIFSIATIIGGTIVIPHLRRAVEYWDELRGAQ
jgi:AhpD family alkylhydroperoxidase